MLVQGRQVLLNLRVVTVEIQEGASRYPGKTSMKLDQSGHHNPVAHAISHAY